MRIVREYAVRVQLSVYELEAEPGEIDMIKEKVGQVIDAREDFIIYFEICESDWQKREKYGCIEDIPAHREFYIY
jgi:CRISPR-associated protein Cas2